MKYRRPLLPCFLLVALLGASVPAAPALGQAVAPAMAAVQDDALQDDALAARVDALFAEWDGDGSPGAAIAVIRDGQLLYSRGYGLANLEYGVPVTPRTVFHIASVSKQFTAFAVGLLAQEGKLSLDDDVRSYVPEVPDFGKTITLRHLIHHTSGLRDQWELLAIAGWRLDDVITREHILKMVANQRALNFEPGAEHLYSNTGYTLLAEVVERVSGQPFRVFTEERIFRPLGMRDTHFHDDHQRIVPNRAYSYQPVPGGGYRYMPLNYANVGATSLFTTVEDLARWDRNFYTGEVGGAELLREMLSRGVLNDGRTISYAHALVWGEYRGLTTIGHGGADAGYRTAYLRIPDHRLAVIVFSNLSTFNPSQLAQRTAAVYLADDLQPERQPRPRASPRAAVRLSEAELRALAGVYANPATDQLRRLEVRDGTLTLLLGAGLGLEPVARNRFVGRNTPVPVEISFEPLGRGVPGMRMREVLGDGEPAVYEPPPVVSAAGLAEYAGSYYSDELGTTYTLVVKDGRLVAEHRRHADTHLVPTSADRFAGEHWWFQRVAVTRGGDGRIDGLLLNGGRVRNLRFVRVEG